MQRHLLATLLLSEVLLAPCSGAAVLVALLRHTLDSSPFSTVQQPALACLVALVAQHPSSADWLLAEPDSRVLPLLPLAFHPLPTVRQSLAQLLHRLLFGAAAAQLSGLAQLVSEGAVLPAGSILRSSVPEPFCAACRFACPAAVLPLGAALHPQAPAGVLGGEHVQRLWRAQQLCEAAAAAEDSPGASLLQLLSGPTALPRWEVDLVRASLAMLGGLSPQAQAAEALQQLSAAQDHAQCQAALHRLRLVATCMPEVGAEAVLCRGRSFCGIC